MARRYIKMPTTAEELEEKRISFTELLGFLATLELLTVHILRYSLRVAITQNCIEIEKVISL